MMPRPRTSSSPAIASGADPKSESPRRSTRRPSSETRRAPSSISRTARSDLPLPDGPRRTTPASQSSTQLACSSTRAGPSATPATRSPSRTRSAALSGSMALRFPGQQPIHRLPVLLLAQAALQGRIAQESGNAGERLQTVGIRRIRRQQQEDQIARLIVEGFEVDRLIEPGEHADQTVEFRQAG